MMRINISRFSIAAVLLALMAGLAGCAQVKAPPSFAEISFTHLPLFHIQVDEVIIDRQYRSPMIEPHIDHLAPISLRETASNWGVQRLRSAGTEGEFRFIVKTASIIEEELPVEEGLAGALKDEQSSRYVGHLLIIMEAKKPDNALLITSRTEVKRATTLPESATLHDRSLAIYKLIDDMLQELNRQLESDLPTYFGPILHAQ